MYAIRGLPGMWFVMFRNDHAVEKRILWSMVNATVYMNKEDAEWVLSQFPEVERKNAKIVKMVWSEEV